MKNKKLLGYRLKDDCKQYKQAAEEIVGYEAYYGDKYDYSIPKGIQSLSKAGVLDLWFDPVYEHQPLPETGKWYRPRKGSTKALVYLTDNIVSDSGFLSRDCGVGFDHEGVWVDKYNLCATEPEDMIAATDNEVEEALIAEAKRRGFKEGCEFKDIDGDEGVLYNHSDLDYQPAISNSCTSEGLWMNGSHHLFHRGKWATVIEKPKTFSPTMELRWRNNPNQYGKFTLEQKFVEVTTGEEKWDDVPMHVPF